MDPVILVELYQGAYGPTLRLDVQSKQSLDRIRTYFRLLANGAVAEVIIEDGPEYRLAGLTRLRCLRLGTAAVPRGRSLRRLNVAGAVECHWTLDPVGWERAVGLVDGLVEGAGPGHQYMNEEGVDDALLELAFMEGPRAQSSDT